MKTPSNPFCTALALALAATLTGGCAKSNDANVAENGSVGGADAAVNVNGRTERSAAAVNLLLAVEQARLAIQHKDKAGAAIHVDAALRALDKIKAVPLVPIYTELTQQSFLAPIEAAKNDRGSKPAAAQTAATPNETQASDSGNAAAPSRPTPPVAVNKVTSGYSQVMLDTSVAKTQLNAANGALDRDDLPSADNSLKALQQSVVLESAVKRMPLVRARENLALASAGARRGNWSDAKAALTEAARSLGDYRQVAPAADVADVSVMQQQIADYVEKIDSHPAGAAAKIDTWWNRAADLSDKRS